MPSGAKKRKAAKKKQEQASSTLINLKSNNLDSRSQGERESDDGLSSQENYKKPGFTKEDAISEHIEITDSSHDHDKSSSNSSSSGSSSNSSSDDEYREVKKRDEKKETNDSVSELITVPDQPIPVTGEAPFMGSTANVIVENTGLMDPVTPSDSKSGEQIEISHVDTMILNETEKKSLPKPTEVTTEVPLASDEVMQTFSSATDSDVKDNDGKTSSLPESNGDSQDSRESEVVITHEEEALLIPSHGITQRTSWFSCCGLFDVATGSSR